MFQRECLFASLCLVMIANSEEEVIRKLNIWREGLEKK